MVGSQFSIPFYPFGMPLLLSYFTEYICILSFCSFLITVFIGWFPNSVFFLPTLKFLYWRLSNHRCFNNFHVFSKINFHVSTYHLLTRNISTSPSLTFTTNLCDFDFFALLLRSTSPHPAMVSLLSRCRQPSQNFVCWISRFLFMMWSYLQFNVCMFKASLTPTPLGKVNYHYSPRPEILLFPTFPKKVPSWEYHERGWN